MNGNGTAAATPAETPEQPAPPPWAHDFLPASCILDCQGPECDQAVRAYWQNNVGFTANGWETMDYRPFCSWICVARYAALKAEGDLASLRDRAEEPAAPRRRTRHN